MLEAEDGPEFAGGGGTAEVRLVVRPIKEPFGTPRQNKKIMKCLEVHKQI